MALSRLLPLVMAIHVRALQERAPASPSLQRYREVAQILTGTPTAQPEDGIAWVRHLCREFHVPALVDFGVAEAEIPLVVAQAQRASSMQGNPIRLSDAQLMEVLAEATRTPA